jgi:dTDP-4-dehydrorhamnose 3,5-epimerase-like enzyme
MLTLPVRGDDRGSLIALEAATGVPFDIRRVYYIFGTGSGMVRGMHAHRQLRQWAVCVAGACTITLDDGHCRSEIVLDAPDQALEIGPMIWREMRDFTPDAVLLVLASEPYDESDYVREYQNFLELVSA